MHGAAAVQEHMQLLAPLIPESHSAAAMEDLEQLLLRSTWNRALGAPALLEDIFQGMWSSCFSDHVNILTQA